MYNCRHRGQTHDASVTLTYTIAHHVRVCLHAARAPVLVLPMRLGMGIPVAVAVYRLVCMEGTQTLSHDTLLCYSG